MDIACISPVFSVAMAAVSVLTAILVWILVIWDKRRTATSELESE